MDQHLELLDQLADMSLDGTPISLDQLRLLIHDQDDLRNATSEPFFDFTNIIRNALERQGRKNTKGKIINKDKIIHSHQWQLNSHTLVLLVSKPASETRLLIVRRAHQKSKSNVSNQLDSRNSSEDDTPDDSPLQADFFDLTDLD